MPKVTDPDVLALLNDDPAPAPSSPAEWLRSVLPVAEAVADEYGLPVEGVLAQAALESGYGKHAPGNNLFGIKSHGKGGQAQRTQEFIDGRMQTVTDSFRDYGDVGESFRDYGEFIHRNPRYRSALAQDDPEAYVSEIARAGYATDPAYADKLVSIIRGPAMREALGDRAPRVARPTAPTGGRVTDPAILAQLNGESPGPATEDPYLALLRARQAAVEPVDEDSQFTKGFKAGGLQLKGLAQGLGALASDFIGQDAWRDSLLSDYQATMGRAAEHAGRTMDVFEVESAGDVLDWAAYWAGNLAPMMASSIVSGGLGAFAARKLATGAVERALVRKTAELTAQGIGKEAAKKRALEFASRELTKATARGAVAGSATSSVGLESASIYGDIYEQTGELRPGTAVAFGLPAGLLDVVPELGIIGRLAGNANADGIIKSLFKQAGKEGATEAGQSAIERSAVQSVDPSLEAFSGEGIREIANAAAVGLLGGSLAGAATRPFSGSLEQSATGPQAEAAPEIQGDQPEAGTEQGAGLNDAEISAARSRLDAERGTQMVAVPERRGFREAPRFRGGLLGGPPEATIIEGEVLPTPALEGPRPASPYFGDDQLNQLIHAERPAGLLTRQRFQLASPTPSLPAPAEPDTTTPPPPGPRTLRPFSRRNLASGVPGEEQAPYGAPPGLPERPELTRPTAQTSLEIAQAQAERAAAERRAIEEDLAYLQAQRPQNAAIAQQMTQARARLAEAKEAERIAEREARTLRKGVAGEGQRPPAPEGLPYGSRLYRPTPAPEPQGDIVAPTREPGRPQPGAADAIQAQREAERFRRIQAEGARTESDRAFARDYARRNQRPAPDLALPMERRGQPPRPPQPQETSDEAQAQAEAAPVLSENGLETLGAQARNHVAVTPETIAQRFGLSEEEARRAHKRLRRSAGFEMAEAEGGGVEFFTAPDNPNLNADWMRQTAAMRPGDVAKATTGDPFPTIKSAQARMRSLAKAGDTISYAPVELPGGGFVLRPQEGETPAEATTTEAVEQAEAPAPPVAPKPKQTTGAGVMAVRERNAADSFVESAMEQFGLSKPEAERALAKLRELKIVRLNVTTGQADLKDGRFWDADVLRRAAEDGPLPAPKKAPAKPRKSPSKRFAEAGQVQPEDTILTAIARLGGLDRTEAEAQGIDPAHFALRPVFGRPAFRKTGGMGFDGMAEQLSQYGYFEGEYSANALLDKVDQELRGEPVLSAQGVELAAERDAQEREAEAEPDALDPLAISAEDLEASGYNDLAGGAEQAEADLRASATIALGEEQAADIAEDVATRFGEASDAEYIDALRSAYDNAIERQAESGRGGSAQDGGSVPQDEAPLLATYDEAELAAREDEVAAAAARREAQRTAEAERAQADRERDDFSLTGSTRRADANPGQADLIDATGRPRSTGGPAAAAVRAEAPVSEPEATPEGRDETDTDEGEPRFSKRGQVTSRTKPRGVSRRVVDQVVLEFQQQFRKGASDLRFRIYEKQSDVAWLRERDLEPGTRVKASVSSTGIVSLIAENMDSKADVYAQLRHEVIAHVGLPRLLGESRWNEILDDVAAAEGRDEVMSAVYAEVRGDYPELSGRPLADEVLARIAERTQAPVGAFREILAKIIRFLRKLGFWTKPLSVPEVRALLTESARNLRRTPPRGPGGRFMGRGQRQALAWHGSNADFDRFDLHQIGTGEGNQQFGWGMYFASNRKVAEFYRDKLKTPGTPGRLYKVDVAPKHEDYLDWDVFLADLAPATQARLERLIREEDVPGPGLNQLGQVFYQRLQGGGRGPEGASRLLAEYGIPGIAYLDQGSRDNFDGEGTGTYNYVVFDDRMVSILDRFSRRDKHTVEETLAAAGVSPEQRREWQKANAKAGKPVRNDVVAQAAADLRDGKIDQDAYLRIVRREMPINPFKAVPKVASVQEIASALSDTNLRKGVIGANESIEDGASVGLRLDIPAYNTYDTWVVSVHDGNSKGGSVLGYAPTAVARNVTFGTVPKAALAIATGKGKATIARMFGAWVNESPESVAKRAKDLMSDPDWVQVGMNPERHSWFYDKADGMPVVSAEEVIQVGALVLAKNPIKTTPDDAQFIATSEGARFSRRAAAAGTAPRADLDAGQRRSVGEFFSDLSADTRKHWFGTLTRQQVVDIASDVLPEAKAWERTAQRMDADKTAHMVGAGETAQRWGDLTRKHPAVAARLADLMHEATVAGIDPSKPREPKADVPTYNALSSRYKTTLNDEARILFEEVRDAYEKRWKETYAAMKRRVERSGADGESKRAMLTKLRIHFESSRVKGPYFPLARFGDYWVRLTKEGAEPEFAMFETSAEQRAFMRSTRVRGLESKGWKVDSGKSLKSLKAASGPSAAFVADLHEVVDGVAEGDQARAIKDGIYQLYLESLPELSVRKHAMHRSNRKGFSRDALRAFASQMWHGSNQLARLKHGDVLADGLASMRESAKGLDSREARNKAADVVKELDSRLDWMMNPQSATWASDLTSLGFVYYLGVSPAAGLVNLTQTAIVALPVLASRVWGGKAIGAAKAGRALTAGLRDYTASRFSDAARKRLENEHGGDLGRALSEAESSGVLERTLAHSLAGLSETEASIYREGRAKAMGIVAKLFHESERANRESGFIAGYRLARQGGQSHAQAVESASDFVLESHFDYSSANRARFMQGNAARVLLLFRQYSQNMTYLLWRNFYQATKGESAAVKREARTKLFGVLGMTSVFAGAAGLPLMGMAYTVANLAAAAFGDDDDPWDAELAWRQFLAENLPDGWGDVAAKGPVNALTGLDLSSRTSLAELWVRSPYRELEGKALVGYWLEQAAGPVAGIAMNLARGAELYGEGKDWRAVETAVPKFAKDIMKAYRYSQEGALNLNGDPVLERSALGPWNQLWQAGGLSPAELNERYDQNSALKKLEQQIKDRRRGLINAWVMARTEGDRDGMDQAREAIRRFNRTNRAVAITGETLSRSLAGRARASQESREGTRFDRRLRQRIEGEAYLDG